MERHFAATAAKDLELTSAPVELQLAKLTAKLREFKAKGEADPSNWGYACSLRKVESDLADILAFIN